MKGIDASLTLITYSLVVGTCESLSAISGRTDCEPESNVLDNIGYLSVDTKVVT